jgi:hypothetical protein
MSQPTTIRIRAALGLTKMRDGNILPMLKGSLNGLRENSHIFKNPPVDLQKYEVAIEAYSASLPAALDGGKTAIEQKNKLRNEVLKIYAQLARYVETICDDDRQHFFCRVFR